MAYCHKYFIKSFLQIIKSFYLIQAISYPKNKQVIMIKMTATNVITIIIRILMLNQTISSRLIWCKTINKWQLFTHFSKGLLGWEMCDTMIRMSKIQLITPDPYGLFCIWQGFWMERWKLVLLVLLFLKVASSTTDESWRKSWTTVSWLLW